ncbi:MAG: hypothetical protein AB1530_02115 [Candidatus Omnitrophota bacterium]
MRNEKGISLIFTFLLLVLVFGSVSVSFLAARTNLSLNARHTAELQVARELDSAKAAALWEISQAGNEWDTLASTTTDSTPRMPGSSITDNFYSLSGHSFRVYVTNDGGVINVFIHAYKDRTGTYPNYKYSYSKYAQYRYVPTPLYQYFIFVNQPLTFAGADNLYKVKGGRIHSNKDITFQPYPSYNYGLIFKGLRFDKLTEMTAAGTIKYAQRSYYPTPVSLDRADVYDENNSTSIETSEWTNATLGYRQYKAPAPYPINYVNGSTAHYHNFTTTDEGVLPGPLAYYYPSSSYKYRAKASDVSGDVDPYAMFRWTTDQDTVNAPPVWLGEDSYFWGKQYNGSLIPIFDVWGYRTNETQTQWMSQDGVINATPYARVNYFDIDASGTGFINYTNTTGVFYSANAIFKPYQNNLGVNNTNVWIEIPGALPQTYKWETKYAGVEPGPVKFYETERCGSGHPGCIIETTNVTNTWGWHYRKKLNGTYCQSWNTTCYNNASATYVPINASTTVPMNGTTQNYFDLIITDPRDRNYEFFDDYSYGDDHTDSSSPYRDIRVFDIVKQPTGFAKYQQQITNLGFDPNIIKGGVTRKYFDLGQLFDKAGADSPYKVRAQQDGIYIDETNANTMRDWLNSAGFTVAVWPKSFANWRTNQAINAFDINVGYLKTVLPTLKPSFNGIIYSKVPIRLNNATELPGTNEGDRKAVFSVLCEESIYLKGNYNTVNWKISHLATKKIIYALTGQFVDRSYVDFWGYNGYEWSYGTNLTQYDVYPYVYHKLNATGKLLAEEGTPGVDNGIWVGTTGDYTDLYNSWSSGGNPYGITYTIAQWNTNTRDAKEALWQSKSPQWRPPNNITNYQYEHQYYNSLFLTPYNFPSSIVQNYTPSSGPGSVLNTQFEDWWYNYIYDFYRAGTVHINGSMINLYDTPGDPVGCCDDEYWSASNATENPLNYRRNPSNLTAPTSAYLGTTTVHQPTVYQEYDDRLPDAVPKNYQAVLGMTGESVWRQISEDYFYNNTGG